MHSKNTVTQISFGCLQIAVEERFESQKAAFDGMFDDQRVD